MRPVPTRTVAVAVLIWLAAAVGVGASGVLSSGRVPPQVVPAALWGLVLAQGVLIWRLPRPRAWAAGVDVRLLVAVHLTRFVGFYFLALYSRGRLPFEFAVPGGWGDIIVAATAIPVLLLASGDGRRPRGLLLVWNVLGLADILMVAATAARLWMTRPDAIAELTRLPLLVLPLWLVPMIIVSHGIMLARLFGWGRGVAAR